MRLTYHGTPKAYFESLDTTEPYLQGDVEFLGSEDVDAPEVAEAAARVAVLFGEQLRLALAISGQWARRLDLPGDPDTMADFVAGNAELPPEEKQALLETLSLPARLSRLAVLLGERIRVLTERWEEQRRAKFAGERLN